VGLKLGYRGSFPRVCPGSAVRLGPLVLGSGRVKNGPPGQKLVVFEEDTLFTREPTLNLWFINPQLASVAVLKGGSLAVLTQSWRLGKGRKFG